MIKGEPPPQWSVELAIDRSTYAVGEKILMRLRVRNATRATYEKTRGLSNARFGIARTGEHSLVWDPDWLRAIPAVAVNDRFEPGQEKTAEEMWDRRLCREKRDGEPPDPGLAPGDLPPGDYEAHASWGGEWAAEPIAFSITPSDVSGQRR